MVPERAEAPSNIRMVTYFMACGSVTKQTVMDGVANYHDEGHFKGYFVNNIRNGWGKETPPNAHTLEGEWKLDKQEGSFTYTIDSRKTSKQRNVNNVET